MEETASGEGYGINDFLLIGHVVTGYGRKKLRCGGEVRCESRIVSLTMGKATVDKNHQLYRGAETEPFILFTINSLVEDVTQTFLALAQT